MKVVVCTKYGPPEVLRIQEMEKPTPRSNEVLIKVRATTVHIGDTKVRRLEPGLGPVRDFLFKPVMRLMIGLRGPRKKILGMELAGDVEAVRQNVHLFKKGDAVFASTEFDFGAYAEYRCIPESGFLALKPENLSYDEAAALSNGGATALHFLKKANIREGKKVLIYGASGSVGTYAVQIAKYFGADVTGVCSTENVDMVRSLGANAVIDYTKEDFTGNSIMYDVIFDSVGKIPYPARKKSLTKSGKYLDVLSMTANQKLKVEDLIYLKELCEQNKLQVVIDRIYPMEEIVEAHRYVDQGHKKGNVIISVSGQV